MKLISIALAFAWHHRLSTTFTMTSVALATALVLLVLHVRRDVEDDLRRQADAPIVVGPPGTESMLALAALFQPNAPLPTMSRALAYEIARVPEVAAVYPFRFAGHVQGAPLVEAIPLFLAQTLSGAPKHAIAAGELFASDSEVVLGAEAARRLAVSAGATLASDAAPARTYRVAGVLAPTRSPKDHVAFAPLPVERGINFLLVQPVGASQEVYDRLRARADIAVVELEGSIEAVASRLLTPLERVLAIHGLTLIILSGGTILATLSVATLARRREYAILRALGAWPREIFAIVIVEAALPLTLGVVFGVLISRVVLWAVVGIPPSQSRAMLDVAWPEILALASIYLVGILAAWWPAWRSYHTDIAASLRQG